MPREHQGKAVGRGAPELRLQAVGWRFSTARGHDVLGTGHLRSFQELDLIAPLCRALDEEGYERPTPIQAQAIPPLLAGRDVLGCAQTGTGKTAAFTLPILQHLEASKRPAGKVRIRALVLTPTRELAAQIGESVSTYGRHLHFRHEVIFGGVNERPQIAALKRGVDILVATPGRLLDLAGRNFVDLSNVDFFVLDEADRMLDMGFVHDVKRVLALLPKNRQNLLFSATMPPAIVSLAGSFLRDPVHVEVTPQATTVERIQQRLMFVERADKKKLLISLLRSLPIDRAIVFSRTKHGANRLVSMLAKAKIDAVAIHGNKAQNARRRALDSFIRGDITVLIATDIASRGIDIDGVSHVFNYDLPNEPESYVHRIGRTGRAGEEGVAISFCDDTELDYLRAIQKLIGFSIEVDRDHEFHQDYQVPTAPAPRARTGKRSRPAARDGSRTRAASSPSSSARPSTSESPSKSRRRRPARSGKPTSSGQKPVRAEGAARDTGRSTGESRPRRARRGRRRPPKA